MNLETLTEKFDTIKDILKKPNSNNNTTDYIQTKSSLFENDVNNSFSTESDKKQPSNINETNTVMNEPEEYNLFDNRSFSTNSLQNPANKNLPSWQSLNWDSYSTPLHSPTQINASTTTTSTISNEFSSNYNNKPSLLQHSLSTTTTITTSSTLATFSLTPSQDSIITSPTGSTSSMNSPYIPGGNNFHLPTSIFNPTKTFSNLNKTIGSNGINLIAHNDSPTNLIHSDSEVTLISQNQNMMNGNGMSQMNTIMTSPKMNNINGIVHNHTLMTSPKMNNLNNMIRSHSLMTSPKMNNINGTLVRSHSLIASPNISNLQNSLLNQYGNFSFDTNPLPKSNSSPNLYNDFYYSEPESVIFPQNGGTTTNKSTIITTTSNPPHSSLSKSNLVNSTNSLPILTNSSLITSERESDITHLKNDIDLLIRSSQLKFEDLYKCKGK